MKKNKLEDSLNKLFSNSGYKMVDVSDKNITHRKALKKQTAETDPSLTKNEKLLAIKQIHKYRNEGKTVVEACKIFNIHPNTYNYWRRSFKISVFKRNDI